MDWSDEYFRTYGAWCSFVPDALECDERLCFIGMYSCGDGGCVDWRTRLVFQRFVKADNDCFTKRNLNYMCEISQHEYAWTLENGLCCVDRGYDDPRYPPWNMIHASKLSDDEICEYLFRCALSDGFEHDCPCNDRNCTQMMMSVCSSFDDHLIVYPPEGLINANIFITYNYTHSMENPIFQEFLLFGGYKCQGFFFQAKRAVILSNILALINYHRISDFLCAVDDPENEHRDFLSPQQNDKFCWNESLTFNGRPYAVNPGICISPGGCISQYRIRDRFLDCLDARDEEVALDKNYCTKNVGRQRFQCFNAEHKCLPLIRLGTGTVECLNRYDESWYGTGTNLQRQIPCFEEVTTACHLVRAYIQQSSSRNSSNNSSPVDSQQQKSIDRMLFRHYCDSFWDLKEHSDEIPSSCQYWICQNNEYQCQTGQCIDLDWVCDGEWDCSDASDEQAIFIIEKWSDHNAQFSNLSSYVEKCRERYSEAPFSKICNTSFELGCYLSRVPYPLNIQSNRPCINLTQIGDGKEDCYNAYDEKNTFTANTSQGSMWGFHFHCGNKHQIYVNACEKHHNCTQILCSRFRAKNGSCFNKKDFLCPEDEYCKKNAWCDGKFDCLNGEDEYWCPMGGMDNHAIYRFDKKRILQLRRGPRPEMLYSLNVNEQESSKSIISVQNDQSFKIHSYQCNRGIAIIEKNETRCLCPPAYYGDWCEFFSDRISIIAHMEDKAELKRISNRTLKIKTNFLFNNRMIDYHEFHIVPMLERNQKMKHQFYLLYSRSVEMLRHKERRYFNRSDVILNHPYSVHFDLFILTENTSVEEIGSWHYPIYFDYLPAFRLAVVLKFPSWLENATLDPCQQNSCNKNSTCMPIFNQNNSYYCSCKKGYYRKDCSMDEPLCETYCPVNAHCQVKHFDLELKKNKLYCICPLGYFGKHCHSKYDECNSDSCLNNGTCFPNYDPSGEHSHLCSCSEYFYGDRCQNEKASVYVDLNMTKTLSTRAAVVQLYNYFIDTFILIIKHQQIHTGLPSSIRFYHSDGDAPELGILKIYEGLSHPQYFLVYFLHQSKINITSSPQHCPHSSLLIPKGQFYYH